ncbi:GNAT family N-acetyltransferase [Catenulispora subtropica]|uniref:BioF2-like acetyltransferase domain-containing protein n=1 Tax=Catenulispora subtropica TaxID=450798 RepID=A0ABP5EH38_9ACTN
MNGPLVRRWTEARYQWRSGEGWWATLRARCSSLPGRRFVHTEMVAGDGSVRVTYAGFPEGRTYVVPYLTELLASLPGEVSVREHAPVSWSWIRERVRQPAADAGLLVVGCSRERAHALPADRALMLPFRVHMLLDVDEGTKTHKSVSPNERRQFAKMRREHEWDCEVGTTEADFDFFYQRMHRPTMELRHGERARSVDRAIARHSLFHRGVLLFVREAGVRVAGVLCRLDEGGTLLRMRLLGVLDGDETHYQSGAVKAVYYLAAEWAADNGVRRIDFSGGDPFPAQGVFQFKRRFRPTIAQPRDHFGGRRVYLRLGQDSPALRDLLVRAPLMTVDAAGRLVGTHFADGARPARTGVRTDGTGVHSTQVLDLDEFLGTVKEVKEGVLR